MSRLADWLGLPCSKFYGWRQRYGLANEHNAPVPRGFWLEPWECTAIVAYARAHPLEGCRRLAFMRPDDGQAVWGVQRQGDAHGRYSLFKRKNSPSAALTCPPSGTAWPRRIAACT